MTEYKKSLDKFKPLKEREFKILLQKYREGNVVAGQRIVESLVKFVIYTLTRYYPKITKGDDDLFNEMVGAGNLGLMVGLSKFHKTDLKHFLRYSQCYIRNYISRAYYSNFYGVQYPYYKAKEVKNNSDNGLSIVSLDANILDERSDLSNTVFDYIQNFEALLIKNEERGELRRLIKKLSKKEQEILNYRFGLDGGRPMTLKEIGEIFKASGEYVRQVEKQAVNKLKDMLSLLHNYKV